MEGNFIMINKRTIQSRQMKMISKSDIVILRPSVSRNDPRNEDHTARSLKEEEYISEHRELHRYAR